MDKPLLDLYADYLISSFGPTTATGLSRLLGAGLSHDKITRFLAGEAMTSQNLWQIVKPLVRQVQKDDAVLVIDDSIVHKPHTDPSELIGWHYDHTTGTSVGCSCSVKGINFLTTLYCVDDVSLPVAFALVEKDEEFTDEKTGKPKRRASVSKNEHYRAMLKACVKNGMPFRYVLNDVWFAAADNMKLIKTEMNKDFVMPLKSNRNVALSEQDKKGGRFQAVQTLPLEHGKAQEVYLEQVGFPLLLVKQVFTNKDASQGLLYLVTSDMTLAGDKIMSLYQERWQVESRLSRSWTTDRVRCSPVVACPLTMGIPMGHVGPLAWIIWVTFCSGFTARRLLKRRRHGKLDLGGTDGFELTLFLALLTVTVEKSGTGGAGVFIPWLYYGFFANWDLYLFERQGKQGWSTTPG